MNYRNSTQDSNFKSALKYSRSNLGNQQSKLHWKITKKNISGVFFSCLGFMGILGWFFWCQPTLHQRCEEWSLSCCWILLYNIYIKHSFAFCWAGKGGKGDILFFMFSWIYRICILFSNPMLTWLLSHGANNQINF